MIYSGNDIEVISELKKVLAKEFEINLGSSAVFLELKLQDQIKVYSYLTERMFRSSNGKWYMLDANQ